MLMNDITAQLTHPPNMHPLRKLHRPLQPVPRTIRPGLIIHIHINLNTRERINCINDVRPLQAGETGRFTTEV